MRGQCRLHAGSVLKSTGFLKAETMVFSEVTLWSGKPGAPSVSRLYLC